MTDKPIEKDAREYWNQKFRGSVQEWRIDYPPEQLLREHGLEVPHRKIVLDYGVGRGDFARFCIRNENIVICCDVCDAALEGVKNIGAQSLLLYADIQKLPPVDLAIANLVFQHCTDEVIINILSNIKLRPGGVFSFQFADAHNPYPDWLISQTASGYLTMRSPARMRRLVEYSGAMKVVEERGPLAVRDFPDTQMFHYFFKCVPA